MKIGFIGDVVGSPGRDELKKNVKFYKEKFGLDFIVANCENASGGFGLSAKNSGEILESGIDAITGGNHSFDKKDIIPLMDELPIIRPYNLYEAPGRGVLNLKKDDKSLSIINMQGIIGLNIAKNAFYEIDEAIKKCESKNILVDFHAEMTSEKMAFFWANKGKVSAILGTHTHVGTDDLHINDGTIFTCDVGLTGAREGVIGMDAQASINGFITGRKQAFNVNKTYKTIFQMVVCEILEGKAVSGFKIRLIDDKEYINEAYND